MPILLWLVSIIGFSQPKVGFVPVISSGLSVSIDVVNAKDGTGRLFVLQQDGLVKIVSGDSVKAVPFLNLTGTVGYTANGERGLLSIAFHPQYATNGYFFVYHNKADGSVNLTRYHVSSNPNVADPASGQLILSIPHPTNSNHNGGKLNFGKDGYLYFATGDGGGSGDVPNNAQTGTVNLGKMLRINVDNFTTAPYYTIPPTNPFVTDNTVNDEIFALGLRNPYRWSFDRRTGDMWIADVGQDLWEEVNFRTPDNMSGVNYGWRCYEGTHEYNITQCGTTPSTNKVMPIFEYPHNATTGGFSITGGMVYRGSVAQLDGYYICNDYLSNNGWVIKQNGSAFTASLQANFPANIAGYGEGEDSVLYAVARGGTLYRIFYDGALPIKLLSFTGNYVNGNDVLQWRATVDPTVVRYEVENSTDGTRFTTLGNVPSTTYGTTADYEFKNLGQASTVDRFYRLKIVYTSGDIQYSSVLALNNKSTDRISVRYDGAGRLQLNTPSALKEITVTNNGGQRVKTFSNVQAGSQTLQLIDIPTGIYWVQCVTDRNTVENFKIAVL